MHVCRPSLRLLLGVAVALSALSCASTLRIRSVMPAPVNLGAVTKLVVVQTEGRRSAREEVIQEMQKQARVANFQFQDRSEEGITVKIKGRQAQIQGAQAPTSEEAFVRVDIIDWSSNRDRRTISEKDKKGKPVEREVEVRVGKVTLGTTIVNAKGIAVAAEKEYEGRSEMGTDQSESEVIRAAATSAVAQMMADITPKPVYRDVELDESEEPQKPIIKVAKEGNVAMAIEEMKKYLGTNPTSPSAHYNLAVFLDASGMYDDALSEYDRAISGSTKKLYSDARAGCAKRMQDQQALTQ